MAPPPDAAAATAAAATAARRLASAVAMADTATKAGWLTKQGQQAATADALQASALDARAVFVKSKKPLMPPPPLTSARCARRVRIAGPQLEGSVVRADRRG